MSVEIDNPFKRDTAIFHKDFFYLQMNFSNKKTAKYKLGKYQKGKNFILTLSESGRMEGEWYNLKNSFKDKRISRDNNFSVKGDYSLKVEGKEKRIVLESAKILNKTSGSPAMITQLMPAVDDYYTFSGDVFIKDKGLKVIISSNLWRDDGTSEKKHKRTSQSTEDLGEWIHISFVDHYTVPFNRIIGLVLFLVFIVNQIRKKRGTAAMVSRNSDFRIANSTTEKH